MTVDDVPRAADGPMRTGFAIVRLRNGSIYEGDFSIDGSWVTLCGRRGVAQASGDVFFGPLSTWTWPERRIDEIRPCDEVDLAA
jgi:hypothetical protein